jgi:hypothetical protein
MPNVAEGKVTPIPSFMTRLVQGVRYAIQGVGPQNWFGPLNPLPPIAPEEVKGRQFDFPVGANLNYTPRSGSDDGASGTYASFEELRALARNLPLLRLIIETRKDQVESMKWLVKPRGVEAGRFSSKEALADPRIDQVKTFFQMPDGQRPFGTWLRMFLEEMFVVDAATVYPRLTRGGDLYSLDLIDGATIKPLIGQDGRRPTPPDPAYQQILHGIPAADFSSDELLYLPRNQAVNRLYGFSPVEQVILTVNIALRRDVHTLNYYKEGTLPDSFGNLPKEWTTQQIADFQKYFDALMTDNLADRRKLKFMPGDFKFQEVRQPPLKDVYDEWLARVICYAFSVPSTPFVSIVNRATADNLQQQAQAEGLVPIQNWLKSVFDVIITRYLKMPDLEFAWDDSWMIDPLKRAQADDIDIKSRAATVNEVRDARGKPPLTDPQADGEPAPPPVPLGGEGEGEENGGKPFGGKKEEGDAEKRAPDWGRTSVGTFLTTDERRETAGFGQKMLAKGDKKTLFIKRAVVNGADIVDWAKSQGFATTLPSDDMHVTVAFSKNKVDWGHLGDSFDRLRLTGGERSLQRFDGGATVLRFESGDLARRWEELCDKGASWDYDEYHPHVTISYKADDVDLSKVKPYDGPIMLGPEITQEVKSDWKNDVVEKYSPNQARDENGRFASSGGASGAIKGRRRKPKEVAGAQWDATTQEGVRVEAAVKVAKAAAFGAAAYYASQYVGRMSDGGWKVAAGFAVQTLIATSIHWGLSSVHALLEQGADAIGMPKEHADNAVKLMASHTYKIVDAIIPPDTYLSASKAEDDRMATVRLLEWAREHADGVLSPSADALKSAIRHEAKGNFSPEQYVEIDGAVDKAKRATIEAISQAIHDLHSGAAEKLAKAQEEWPAGKKPRERHFRNMRAFWNDILACEGRRVAEALRGQSESELEAYAGAWMLKAAGPEDVDFSAYEDEAAELIAEAAADGGGAGVMELFDKMGTPPRVELRTAVFERSNARAQSWARTHAAILVSQTEDSTKTAIRRIVTKGLEEGLSIAEIADEIQNSTAFSKERAELIAENEVTTANSRGAVEGYKAARDEGLAVKKRWVVAVGACPLCIENAEAGAVDLDSEFPNGVQAPSQHPRCRCAVSAEVEEDDAEKFVKNWDESKHPRADDGKFSDGSGGSATERARKILGELYAVRPLADPTTWSATDEENWYKSKYDSYVKNNAGTNIGFDDFVAMRTYTNSSRFINNALARGEDSIAVSTLRNALSKLPSVVNKATYRGLTASGAALEALMDPGSEVGVRGFTSTSFSKDVAEEFAHMATKPGERVILHISDSVTGRDISHFSMHPDEEEVLFAPDARFRVMKNEVGVSRGAPVKIAHLVQVPLLKKSAPFVIAERSVSDGHNESIFDRMENQEIFITTKDGRTFNQDGTEADS